MADLVLVTGASGFIAKHIIKLALARGYRVRGTLRRPDAAGTVRAAVEEAGPRLTFATADLLADDGWREAVAGCRYVFHVAAAFPLVAPRDRHALVPVARDGTLRVLRAAAAEGVERTFLTSSCVAIWSGHRPDRQRVYTEADWSLTEAAHVDAYALAKTLAERAAWEFARASPRFSLTSLNPSLVLGPPLDRHVDSSAEMLLPFFRGEYPLVPDYGVEIVDVRDVAEAHLRAAETPASNGRRIILSSGAMTLRDMGRVLGREFPAYRARMPKATLPNVAARALAPFRPGLRQILPDLGPVKRTSNGTARDLLALQFRPPEEAVIAMAAAILKFDMI